MAEAELCTHKLFHFWLNVCLFC